MKLIYKKKKTLIQTAAPNALAQSNILMPSGQLFAAERHQATKQSLLAANGPILVCIVQTTSKQREVYIS